MAEIVTRQANGFWGLFFAAPEERRAHRKRKLKARERQRELDQQVAKDLRDVGYFDDHMPDAYFYRHYYF